MEPLNSVFFLKFPRNNFQMTFGIIYFCSNQILISLKRNSFNRSFVFHFLFSFLRKEILKMFWGQEYFKTFFHRMRTDGRCACKTPLHLLSFHPLSRHAFIPNTLMHLPLKSSTYFPSSSQVVSTHQRVSTEKKSRT